MIETLNICKSFDGTNVLNNISSTFKKGLTNLIIGQSGSGKTVFLKSLVGLHQVDSGEIFYDGRNFTKMPLNEKKLIRKEIGMLFQGSALFDSLTVEENVRFPLDMFTDMSINHRRERANFCLNRVNLENVNHLYPSEISGGMQKRVAILEPYLSIQNTFFVMNQTLVWIRVQLLLLMSLFRNLPRNTI